MITFNNVALGYRGTSVLEGINFSLQAGDSIGLVGPNGAGKTTFLRAVLGLLKPLSGTIEVDRTQKFAYVPQVDDQNSLWPLTVRQVVSLAARSRRTAGQMRPEERQTIEEAMERTGIASLASSLYTEISGGQRQRTILAQALSQQPDILLLDEPTRGLDVAVEQEFLKILKNLREKENLTILLVTHTLSIPLNFSEKILLFKDKHVVVSTSQELKNTNKLYELFSLPSL